MRIKLLLLAGFLLVPSVAMAQLRVGAAEAEFAADDGMVIGGGILPGKARGQEGKLRAVAVVLDLPGSKPIAIVACDVLMLNRDLLDAVAEEIEKNLGIPASNVLINATHTHHAPSTCRVHGYDRDEVFCRHVQRGVASAVKEAKANLTKATAHFRLGEESSVGQNSRLLLQDNTIFWIGRRDDAVRPTGPFDPELPVLAFRGDDMKPIATIFNHSTHTIGAREPGKRSPGFYGLAAQELESEVVLSRRSVRVDAQFEPRSAGDDSADQVGREGSPRQSRAGADHAPGRGQT
jgi:hypothetical protein